jgi:hypothetical protein
MADDMAFLLGDQGNQQRASFPEAVDQKSLRLVAVRMVGERLLDHRRDRRNVRRRFLPDQHGLTPPG